MDEDEIRWFVMRDLTRANARTPAYRMLEEIGVESFTPMTRKILTVHGRRECRDVPFLHDLVFAHDSRAVLDPIVQRTPTLQYRFLKGREPMVVRDKEMDAFKAAVLSSDMPRYYRPEEVTPAMRHHKVRIIGGPLNGSEGYLQSCRGSRHRRLLIEIPSVIAAAVEVEPDYIQLI